MKDEMDTLMKTSSLKKLEIQKIVYIKQLLGEKTRIHGTTIFDKQWRLNLKNPFLSQRKHNTDVEGDSMLEMEGSLGEQAFVKVGRKRAKSAWKLEEKNWECLFWAIYYHMCQMLKEQIQKHHTGGHLRHFHPLPFTELVDLQYWSSEFTTSPIPDATDLQKPDLVLLDYRLRKSDSLEKSWKDVLTDRSSHGFDSKIHICNSCSTAPSHTNLPDGFNPMLPRAIGWVYDNDQNVYWIMEILWKSCRYFKHGTFGWEYALKDCWVNEDVKDVKIDFLKAVDGIKNVVQLVKYWDVLYDGQPNSTSCIHSHCPTFVFEKKIHRHILLTPCGLPLVQFNDIPELIGVFHDLVVGKGYFIDFDHAKFLDPDGQADKSPHGTDPRVHWPPDLTKKICNGTPFRVTSYFTPCHNLLDEWCWVISLASIQSTAISHDGISDILTQGLNLNSEQIASIPPALPSMLEPTIALSPPPTPLTSQLVTTIAALLTVPPSLPCTCLHSADPTPDISIAQVLVHTYMTDPHIYTRELAMIDEEASAMRRFQALYASRTSASISKHVKSYGPAPVTVFHKGSVLATSAYKGTTVSLDQIHGITEVVRLLEIYFKVIPTSVSTITIHPVRHTKDEMDILMKSELGKQDKDFRVLWEEDF
ncbi:hypothetical protein BDR06DRAFT_969463 [Suillus hirtellus]|nr:hypothetical protein BDR06DRAFT_969463 [Suillus hirtellus]